MQYPEIDSRGELTCLRSGSNYELMVQSVAAGNSLLIVEPPAKPSWWDSAALAWVAKPDRPSAFHVWDAAGKSWVDPRNAAEVDAQQMASLRQRRDAALVESDVMLLRALDALAPEPLREYRAALRNLPTRPGAPAVSLPARPVLPSVD